MLKPTISVGVVALALLLGNMEVASAETRHCSKVQTGERLVYEIRAIDVSCRTARRVARVGWQASPRGWECEYRPSSNRYYCESGERRVRFKAIGAD